MKTLTLTLFLISISTTSIYARDTKMCIVDLKSIDYDLSTQQAHKLCKQGANTVCIVDLKSIDYDLSTQEAHNLCK